MLEWHNEKRKVKELIPADYNPRYLTDKDRYDLEQSITRFNEVEPVVINIGSRNNVLIGGHQRLIIYADLGKEEIDVRVPNRELTIEEETELNLRLNKNTGSWDWNKLKDIDINKLLDVGFSDEELSILHNEIIDDEEEGIQSTKKEKITTEIKNGDIIKLGQHTLMCGDSTKIDDVKKLMGGNLADVIYCDPPYNIGLDYNEGMNVRHQNRELQYQGQYTSRDDKKSYNDYYRFIEQTMRNSIAVAKNDSHFFYWCDQTYIGMIQQIFKENGITNRRVCLWIKNISNPTPQIAFNKLYEPCVYGTRGRPYLNKTINNLNEILNKQISADNIYNDIMLYFDLWLVSRDSQYDHPTQKPISLNEKPIKRCSKVGDIILDLFGGSGSTLLACEQMKRKCFIMENDPLFCQVIVNRFNQSKQII